MDRSNPNVRRPAQSHESRPYFIGPSIELRLPAGFALEADALYQRVGNTQSYPPATVNVLEGSTVSALTNRLRGNLWEFPLLGKYYFRRDSNWQPFLGTGWAMRFAGIQQAGTETVVDSSGASNSFAFKDSFRSGLQIGASFAAGLRYRAGHFAFLPEVRYTRWAGSNGTLRRDEAAFFLGIAF